MTPTEQPASTRSENMSEEVQGNLSHRPAETENPNINETANYHRETRCLNCQNSDKNSHVTTSEERGTENYSIKTFFLNDQNCEMQEGQNYLDSVQETHR